MNELVQICIFPLVMGYLLAGHGLSTGWLWAISIYWLAMTGLSTIYGLAMELLWAGYYNINYLWAGYSLAIGISAGYQMGISYIWADYQLSAGYPLAIGWLWPEMNSPQDSHILCTKVAHGCNQYLTGLHCSVLTRSAGNRLAIFLNQYTLNKT